MEGLTIQGEQRRYVTDKVLVGGGGRVWEDGWDKGNWIVMIVM